VQLYVGNWQGAIDASTTVIGEDSYFSLESDLTKVFLVASPEAIWQGASHLSNTNTAEANVYLTNSEHFLAEDVLDVFPAHDRRREQWIWLKDASTNQYVPYKYRSTSVTQTTEYSIILR